MGCASIDKRDNHVNPQSFDTYKDATVSFDLGQHIRIMESWLDPDTVDEETQKMLMEPPIPWDPPEKSPTPSRRQPTPPPRENLVERFLRTQANPLLKRSPSYRYSEEPPCLLRFLEEAETFYTHLVENIDDETSEERILPIEYIGSFWDRDYECDSYAEEVEQRYGEPLKRAYQRWLCEERACGRLLDRACWQIYRDHRTIVSCYLGYRRLFVYEQHYFQVSYDMNQFCLTLYGWTDGSCDTFLPERKHTLADMIPECHWFYSV